MATRKRVETSSSRRQARGGSGGRSRSRAAPPERADVPVVASAAEAAGTQLLQGVQQVWLAGMGAISRGQKDGPAAFQEAVAEGLKLLNRSRSTAQDIVRDAFEGAQESLQSRMGGAREQAQETWDNIEALFQTRVQRALQQLGVPSAEEIRLLARRVAELNESVDKLNALQRKRPMAQGTRQAKTPRKAVRRARSARRARG
jgi:poly(hydroxyalkanoate) granule-associated protein